jgi:carboxylesterase
LPAFPDEVDTRLLGEDGFEAASAHALRRSFYFAGEDRSTVLLIHGFTGTPFEMRPLGEHLARAGHTVYAPLLNGHGLTSEALLATRAENWIRSVDEAMDLLLARTKRIYLCGLSLGGLLSLDATRRRGAQVSALASIGAPLWLTRMSDLAIRVTRRLGGAPRFVIPKMSGSDIADPAMRRLNDRAQGSIGLPMPSVMSLHSFAAEVHARLDQITRPVFAAHGRKDHVTPHACLDALVRGLRSAEVESFTAERSYHVATLDYDREALFSAVAAHIAHAHMTKEGP